MITHLLRFSADSDNDYLLHLLLITSASVMGVLTLCRRPARTDKTSPALV